jgi:hypothetical protein
MKARLLRRLGHFEVERPEGFEPVCARYFYDLSYAEAEVADLLEHRIKHAYKAAELKDSTLVLFGARSPWMSTVGSFLEARLGCGYVELSRDARGRRPKGLSSKCNILLFDMISTGDVRDQAVAAFAKWGLPVGKEAFTALTTDPSVLDEHDVVTIGALAKVSQRTVVSAECPQCAAHIPHDRFQLEEHFVAISAYDMWSMMLDVPWAPETYGADKPDLYDYIPNFGVLFERYGPWIAYKYRKLLDHLGHAGDVVMVHPDEDRAGQLIRSLQTSFGQRLVAVGIPRPVLDAVRDKEKSPEEIFDEVTAAQDADDELEDWQRQLLQLRGQHGAAHVLGIDEFNASGRSARALVDILHAFGIEVAAYLPFLDRQPGAKVGNVPAHALYKIVSPRAA